MKKFAFYPVLFSINPILLLLAANISDVPVGQLFPVIVISPVVAAGLMWLLNRWIKNIHRAGFSVFLLTFWFFHYGTVHLWVNNIHVGSLSLGTYWIFLPIWTLIFIFLSSQLVWSKITSPETITLFLNIICIIIVGFSILRISLDLAPRYTTHPDVAKIIETSSVPSLTSDLPDVYYIIVDGYARADILQELYQFDNSAFLKALQNRGFMIAGESQSNYSQTAISIASSLNMEYLTSLPKTAPDRGQLIGMIQNSRVGEIFEHLGYKTVAFSSGYQPTEIIHADYYFSSPKIARSHDLEALLLINSVANILIEQGWLDLPITRYSTQQERISYIFNALSEEVPLIKGPKWVFAHIIAPHPPFIFNQTGPISPDNFYILDDGQKYRSGIVDYPARYVNQLTYVNNQLLHTIDNILAKSTIPPVIIIQADHGAGSYYDRSSVDNTCIKERFSILNVIYLPKHDKTIFEDNISPVNTFPALLNAYFGTGLVLQENKEYYSTWDNPYNFIDVSDKSQVPCDVH